MGSNFIRYFVSYTHQTGFGSAEVPLTRPIRDMSDVFTVSDAIERDRGLSGVVVLNWRRFEDAE